MVTMMRDILIVAIVFCAVQVVAADRTLAGHAKYADDLIGPLWLEGAAATGGAKNKEGNTVYLTAAIGVKEEARWTFAKPLPAGAWRLTVESSDKTGSAKDQVLGFVDDHTPSICGSRLKVNGSGSFVLVTAVPAQGLFYRKSVQRNQDTIGIRSIKIEKLESPPPAEGWSLVCLVSNGQVALPWPLAPGSFMAAAASPVTLTWSSADEKFQTPPAVQTYVYSEKPVERIAVQGKVEWLAIERLPAAPVPDMPVPNQELIQAVDANKPESRTLTLVGAQTGAPVIGLFPFGRKHAIFTSWDDGRPLDITLARTLKKYGFRGTLFMTHHSDVLHRLPELEAMGMEIGSHSWHHPAYVISGYQRCLAESVNMRKFLENALGHPVISFAYPYRYAPAYDAQGDYVIRSMEAAGYWFARTTGRGSNYIDSIESPLVLFPDFQFNAGAKNIAARFAELTKKEGVVFHIWGHSYELAGNGQATLEAILTAMGGKPDVWYTTGGELFVWRWMRQNTRISSGIKDAQGLTFTLTRPWLHPYLRTVPLAIRVPEGVTEVIWNGQRQPVTGNTVDLKW